MTRDTLFMRTAARIGDLGSPFYDEERRRDVWNEASAVGFQVLLWAGLALSTAALWIGGGDAVPYALALLLVTNVGGWVTIAYAQRLGVEVEQQHVSRARLVPHFVLLTLFTLGLYRAGLPYERDTTWDSFRYGAASGAAVAMPVVLLVGIVLAWRESRSGSVARGGGLEPPTS